MIIKVIPAGIYDANCYIVIDEKTKDCIVMDPGGDAPMLINQIDSLGVKPKFILLTHGHVDHVSG
ncbi:MAG: MBL fold metallo-hydrolase, partial [Sarcina sp.]